MMKRKILAVVLPLIGCATVVGSGFAAWYFGDTIEGGAKAKLSPNVNITAEIDSESTTLTGSYTSAGMPTYLILDQGPARADNGLANDDETQGIAFASEAKSAIKSSENVPDFVFTVNYEGGTKSLKDLKDEGNYRIRVEVKIDLTALKGYVDLVDNAQVVIDETVSDTINGDTRNFTEGEDNVYTATYIAPTKDTSTKANWTFTLGLSTTEYRNELLKYAEGKKPTNHEKYAEMAGENGIGTSAQINITATAYLEIDPTVGA